MATRAQRIKVGVFLLIGFGLIAAGTLLMSGYNRQPTTPYWMEFNESVLGLNVGAVVEYLGVPVGQVENIQVTDRNSARVDVSIKDEEIVLREGVSAKLVMFSLATGVMYISLSGGGEDAPILEPGSEIPTEPALISSLMETFTEVQDEVVSLLDRIGVGLEGMEPGDITRILNNTEILIADMDALVNDIDDTVNELRPDLKANMETIGTAAGDVSEASKSLTDFFDTASAKIEPLELQETNEEAQELIKSLNGAIEKMQTAVDSVSGAVESIVHEADNVEYSVRQSLDSLVDTLESVQELTENLRDDPSSLLRGRGRPRGDN